MTRPDRTEASEYYFRYIDQAVGTNVSEMLERQLDETLAFLERISDERSLYRYEPEKWSIREVVGHVNDSERLFVSRAFWFSRGFDAPLPSFDEKVAASASGAHDRSWKSHKDEFRAVRASTIAFFQGLPAGAWDRRGIASGHTFTVRALAYVMAGHLAHHVAIVRQRYV
jgi:hypothetical protein